MREKKYYKVVAKCGHVGRNNYIEVEFPVRAYSKKEAAEMVRMFPRVKHHQKDAIKMVSEIDVESYNYLKEEYSNDNYNFVHSIQEQKLYCGLNLYEKVKREEEKIEYDKFERKLKVSNKIKYAQQIDHEIKKYMKFELCYC